MSREECPDMYKSIINLKDGRDEDPVSVSRIFILIKNAIPE